MSLPATCENASLERYQISLQNSTSCLTRKEHTVGALKSCCLEQWWLVPGKASQLTAYLPFVSV